MNYQTVTYLGIDLLIGFKVDGKYYPATLYDPAEYPEIEIHDICIKDVSVFALFEGDEYKMDQLHNLLNELL